MNEDLLFKFLIAALFGGIIGAEREYRSKSAGFRTMIMISVGSCLFTMISSLISNTNAPERIASNIVTGIGFLGAGVIFRGENRVNGITTAATIWAVAAIGMAVGMGQYEASAYACILIILILAVLPYVEAVIDQLHQTRTYSIQCVYSETIVDHIHGALKKHHLKNTTINQVKQGNTITFNGLARGQAQNLQKFTDAMWKDENILRFEL